MQVLFQLQCPLLHYWGREVFLDRSNRYGDKHGRLRGCLGFSFLCVALETLGPSNEIPVATFQAIPITLSFLRGIWIFRLPLAGCEKGGLYCIGIHSRCHQCVPLSFLSFVVTFILITVIIVHHFPFLVHTTPFHGLQLGKQFGVQVFIIIIIFALATL